MTRDYRWPAAVGPGALALICSYSGNTEESLALYHEAGRWVGICGEMAGDPRTAILLVGLGVDELSMSCYDLPRVKAALRSVRDEDARELASRALELSSAGAVKELLRQRLEVLLPSFLVAKRSPM